MPFQDFQLSPISYPLDSLPLTVYVLSHQSPGIAVVIFSQTLGGSVFLAVAQTIFSHSLATSLAKYAPTVSVRIAKIHISWLLFSFQFDSLKIILTLQLK
jgi:hypothetical protein